MSDRDFDTGMFEAATEDLNSQINIMSENCSALFFDRLTMDKKLEIIEQCEKINKQMQTSLILLKEAGKEINKSKSG